ncbi:hypothetical protein [Piscinibacter sp.]|jgi:hypothetical protein|uniref:hypothetical protein n=1 Tax=Piscinibacter sp. TaxID=1903157 RepID=UPI003559E78B
MNRTSALLALAALVVSAPAMANRPLNTDTADTITDGRCQFEPYVASTRSRGVASLQSTLVQLNCGVTPNTQLGVAAFRSNSAGETTAGVLASGKTNVVELKDGQTGVALSYGLGALKNPGAAWVYDSASLNLIGTRELVPGLLGHANLGWTHSRSAHQSSTTWAFAFEWAAAPKLDLSVEAYGDDRNRPWLSTGVHWVLGKQFSVNASFGVQSTNPHVRQLTAGFNVEF